MKWDESKHPRVPDGVPEGGEFTDNPAAWAQRVAASAVESRYNDIDYPDVEVGGGRLSSKRGQALPVSNLTEKASIATMFWCDDGICQTVTAALRTGEGIDGYAEDVTFGTQIRVRRYIMDMDAAVRQGRLTKDSVLWRGLALRPGQAQQLFVPGTEVTDKAFMAMAMEREGAERIMKHRIVYADEQLEPWMMKILAPAGMNVAPGSADIKELVGPRRTKTRVLRVTPGVDGQPGEIVLEVVP